MWWRRCSGRESVKNDALAQAMGKNMVLLGVYLLLMVGGTFGAYLIGLMIEQFAPPGASLPAFLAMYFLVLWVGWLLAVRITEPRLSTK